MAIARVSGIIALGSCPARVARAACRSDFATEPVERQTARCGRSPVASLPLLTDTRPDLDRRLDTGSSRNGSGPDVQRELERSGSAVRTCFPTGWRRGRDWQDIQRSARSGSGPALHEPLDQIHRAKARQRRRACVPTMRCAVLDRCDEDAKSRISRDVAQVVAGVLRQLRRGDQAHEIDHALEVRRARGSERAARDARA